MFDAAIIGAGPAGSSAAIGLARRGYAVALLDKERFPREKLCGDFINPSNWPWLEEIGARAELLSCEHETVTGFRLTSCDGAAAEAGLSATGPAVYGLGLRRFFFDHILVKRATGAGAVAFQGCRLERLERCATGWSLEFRRAGIAERLNAKMLVGADGRNSWVARRLDMIRGTAAQARAVGFQLRLNYSPGLAGRVEIHLFPGGYAGVLGLGDGTINLCLAAEKSCVRRGGALDSLLECHLPQNPYLEAILRRSEPIGAGRSVYPVYFPPRRTVGERVVLVGDAARVSEPVTGEGVYFAIKSGALAAQTIDEALRCGDFSVARLEDYRRRCEREFRLRRGLNALIRFFVHRPSLVSPLARWSGARRLMLQPLVHAICAPETAA